MENQQSLQILQMSSLPKQQILRTLINLFNQNTIQRFTILIKKTPIKSGQSKQEFSLAVDQTCGAITTRPKSSTIDKYYRTSHFMQHQKSMTMNQSHIDSAFSDSQLPQSPKELGNKLYQLGEYQQALQIFEQLKEQFPLQKNVQEYRRQYNQVLNNLGNCCFRLNQYQKAVETYKEFIKQFKMEEASQKQERLLAQCYNNLGCCYGKMGYEKLSMNSYKEALKIYNKYPEVDSSTLLFNIANTYFNCQMYQVSQKYYHEAIIERIFKRPQDKNLLSHAYYKLSIAQTHNKKYKEALESLAQAYKLTDYGFGSALEILKQSAYIKQLQGKWEQALEFYQKMHILQQDRSKSFIFQSVAKIYFNIGKLAEYKKYIDLALQEYKKEGDQRKVSELSANWSQHKLKK